MADLPSVRLKVQAEETQTRFAVAESVLQKTGSSINWILDNVQQSTIGDVVMSVLNEAQFQAERGTGWVLMDGRSVIGSEYETVTGNSNIPDARGRYLRMQDHGAGVNPAGNITPGNTQADENASHQHIVSGFQFGGGPNTGLIWGNGGSGATFVTSASGGAETRPRTIIVNVFIRID